MSQRKIFLFWLPLFASWLLMTAEGPTISATINRLPDEVVMLAAQGVVISLSVLIESPIINLLATSTALVKDRPSFLLMRRFTIHWAIFLTIITVLIAFTPLFDVVVKGWLGVVPEIAVWVKPGLQIMTFWSAAIAWRRFLQGVLIHFEQTKHVAWGTVIRLLASAGTVIGLALITDWAGVIIAATALMAGVIAEAAYATWAVRSILGDELSQAVSQETPLTYQDLFWFHLPLAGTSVLILLAQPLVTSSLTRLENPTESLAAWPLVFQALLMARAAAFALPEVVIALTKNADSITPIRRFSLTLTAATTAIMALLVFTPLAHWYLFTIQDATSSVGEAAQVGLTFFLLFPSLTVLVSWIRGLLIVNRATKAVNMGMAVNLVITGIILVVGLQLKSNGLATAATALNIAILFELLYLLWRIQQQMDLQIPILAFLRPRPSTTI